MFHPPPAHVVVALLDRGEREREREREREPQATKPGAEKKKEMSYRAQPTSYFFSHSKHMILYKPQNKRFFDRCFFIGEQTTFEFQYFLLANYLLLGSPRSPPPLLSKLLVSRQTRSLPWEKEEEGPSSSSSFSSSFALMGLRTGYGARRKKEKARRTKKKKNSIRHTH